MLSDNISSGHFIRAQIVLMVIWLVSQSESAENALKWATVVARFTFYLLTARGIQELFIILSSWSTKQPTASKLCKEYKTPLAFYAVAAAIVVTSRQTLFGEEFFLLFAAFLICQYLQTEGKQEVTINYGTGMACSFFEGYLKHIIPDDGNSGGFVGKMRAWEASQGVVFPVKRLLLVITKTLWCPPDLSAFNLPNREDLPQIEACVDKSLEEVAKDVAGVKNRRYSNTIYRIYWPDRSRPALYLATECATPLHTLHGVLQNHYLYQELANVDKEGLVRDFTRQLQHVVWRDPATRGKCELVFFDNSEGSRQYLPQVLVDKVAELEPDYRGVIARHSLLMADTSHTPRTPDTPPTTPSATP